MHIGHIDIIFVSLAVLCVLRVNEGKLKYKINRHMDSFDEFSLATFSIFYMKMKGFIEQNKNCVTTAGLTFC